LFAHFTECKRQIVKKRYSGDVGNTLQINHSDYVVELSMRERESMLLGLIALLEGTVEVYS